MKKNLKFELTLDILEFWIRRKTKKKRTLVFLVVVLKLVLDIEEKNSGNLNLGLHLFFILRFGAHKFCLALQSMVYTTTCFKRRNCYVN